MTEIKQSRSTSETIERRLRNSGDTQHADTVVQKGTGPTRTNSNVHNSRNQQYGEGHPGEGDIYGRKRTTV